MTAESPSAEAAGIDNVAARGSTSSNRVCFEKNLEGEFNGQQVRYRAVAEETFLCDERGVQLASLFSVSYLAREPGAAHDRPVSFAFNGGPGSSSQWLHVGALGPRRMEPPVEPENMGAPPFALLDNLQSVLDLTDLVFIDPVGTGFSRTLGTKDPKDYRGVLEDARSVADFIQLWITENQRWNAPKYIVGESYGTTRACVVADMLASRYIGLNGIVMAAGVSDYQHHRPRAGDAAIMPYVSFLPSYAAVAWYHKKAPAAEGRTLEAFLEDVELFARTEYATALIANSRLPTRERARVVDRLAAYTGLSSSYIDRARLRITPARFFKELLRESSLVTGRLDGRFTGCEPDSVGEHPESDPMLDAVGTAVTTAMHVHLTELGVQMPNHYEPLTSKVLDAWNWRLEERTPNGAGYVNVVPYLGRAMRRNRHLRVLVTSGYYDLATPFFGVENCMMQDGLVHEQIRFCRYPVGHMFFLHEPSRVKFLNDVRQFIRDGGPIAGAAPHDTTLSSKDAPP
jgi:carboxypeptidase C (cathepsin A)